VRKTSQSAAQLGCCLNRLAPPPTPDRAARVDALDPAPGVAWL